ncbi:MAG: glycosyl hydrolase-related protein [Clostridiales bacterium]|jgi:alpha-mannosidase|nr:glycosyl hydrolase-related protein [Clostridiales bacterium]
MNLQAEWRDRLQYWIQVLTQDFYEPLDAIEFEGFTTFEQLTLEAARARAYSPMRPGESWGREWEYAWLKADIEIPAQAAGKMIVLSLDTGGESALFLDGRAYGTLRASMGLHRQHWSRFPHHLIQDNILCESAEAGRKYELFAEAYAGHFYPDNGGVGVGPVMPGAYGDPLAGQPRAKLGVSTFGVWNEDAYQLWVNVCTLADIMQKLPDSSLRAAKIARGLKDFTLAVDFEQPAEGRLADYAKGREILKPLLAAINGTSAPTFYGIGNAHLDITWLWPFAETVRKTARTFAGQLRLIEKYPGYKFLQSQPQSYQMCKENYPELYERIKEAVKGGGWIVEGGMWVEPDTNMSSGEALVRQLLYGTRFFREEFGVECEILWLPDTFGYSAVLPQLLKGFGIKYLVTQKIFWSYNEGEQFPYHYFTWQGNDGTEIVSFLPTSYTYRTNPGELIDTWNSRVQKDEMDKFLLPFGYGDGGGGPTRDYIEFGGRLADLEGAPKFKFAHPAEIFRDLEKDGGPVHKYTGELYFTAHRGVYTSQAGVKWGNRKSELALREAEMWSAIAAARSVGTWPAGELEAEWKKVLLNQFHDILPGSSIGRVYREAAILHKEVIAKCGEMAAKAMASLLRMSGAGEDGSITIFNSLSWDRIVVVELPEHFAGRTSAAGRAPVADRTSAAGASGDKDSRPVWISEDGGKVYGCVEVPSCGYVTLSTARGVHEGYGSAACGVSLERIDGLYILENDKIQAAIDDNGEIVSFKNKSADREFAAGPMNRFLLYKDVPRVFDAWDIDSPYEEQLVENGSGARVTVECETPLRSALRVEKTIGNSTIVQIISLDAFNSRVEFKTTVEWNELHRLLKVSFPVNVTAAEGINEIQFGYVRRPTHRSRQYDKDRFEVCNHRYTALCDEGGGAAVLNDCKYGVSMLENTINLTLLRAPGAPEMRADNGTHHFTYALDVWEGPFAQSEVVRHGYELNVPVTVTPGGPEGSFSFFKVDAPNVIIDTVKCAEDGSGDIIVRLYEALRRHCSATITCALPFASARLCELTEALSEPAAPAPSAEAVTRGRNVAVEFKPFQIRTLRFRLRKD